eukprot:s8428_g5.t1
MTPSEYEEAVASLWQDADPQAQKVLRACGIEPPKADTEADPRVTLHKYLAAYKSITQAHRSLVERKVQLQARADRIKTQFEQALKELADVSKDIATAEDNLSKVQNQVQEQLKNAEPPEAGVLSSPPHRKEPWHDESANMGIPLPLGTQAEEGSDTHSSPGLAKELSQRADTCPRVALRSLLQTPPASDLQSKEAQLLQWVEDALVEGTLGHWVAYRIMTCLLESREEDTIGILAAVEEVTGAHEFVLLQANVTTYRQEALQAHIQIQVDWDVSFKPHAALRYVLQKNSLTLPALFATVTDPDSCRWGATVRKIESEMGVSDPGRAWCYPVKRKPLVETRPANQPWQGGKIAYWERLLLWAKQRQLVRLKPSHLYKLFLKELNRLEHMLPSETEIDGRALKERLLWMELLRLLSDEVVRVILERAKEEAADLVKYGPIQDTQVEEVLRKLSKKEVGPDGISAHLLRALNQGQIQAIAREFRAWEETSAMPRTVILILWYPLHDRWLAQYRAISPWDAR